VAVPRVPLLILVGSALAAGTGVVVGAAGLVQTGVARRQNKLHAARYEERHSAHLGVVETTNEALQAFGRTQEEAQHQVIFPMRDFLERQAKQVRAHEHLILDGVDGSNTRVVGMARLDPDVAGWVQGIVNSVAASRATPGAVRAGVTRLARASTGTPIADLNGAAAEKATLAFLGGGSIKSGGGGIKLGSTVLKVATVSPMILIAGLTVMNRGVKARTESDAFRTDVDVAIAQLDGRDELLRGVQERTRELDQILSRLASHATEALDLLESEPFTIDLHAERLQAALILVKAVRDVATAPVANESGDLDESTDPLIFQYRDTATEAANG
jgi:hypothetical protein